VRTAPETSGVVTGDVAFAVLAAGAENRRADECGNDPAAGGENLRADECGNDPARRASSTSRS
jgi:hypothetical protein